jgi:uncharacterized protein HemX
MKPIGLEPEREVGSFSRLVSESGRAPRAAAEPARSGVDPVAVCRAVHAEMRAETRRARRMAGLAWSLLIAAGAGAGYALYTQAGQVAALRQERSSLSADLAGRQARIDRLNRQAERQQSELTTLYRNASASTRTASALDAEIRRLTEELDRTRTQLRDAEQRESQARTRWAYAEGERDALFLHLETLLERLESVLQTTDHPAVPTLDNLPDAYSPEPLPAGE